MSMFRCRGSGVVVVHCIVDSLGVETRVLVYVYVYVYVLMTASAGWV